MACKCVLCDECNGSGNVWYSFSGEYLGRYRCDDLDELDVCPECGGSEIAELCDECYDRDLYEEAQDEDR